MRIKDELFQKQVIGGIQGSVVGDAIGVPTEFMSRKELHYSPIEGMVAGGVHGQPIGTWSDDTSMTLCTIDSLIEHGIDYTDQMVRFSDWLWRAANTAHDEVFDVGGATKQSIFRFAKGTSALECGELAEYSCGNGSLMRLFPTAMYVISRFGNISIDDYSAEIIHNTSKCTHQHPKCQMACGILFNTIASLSNGGNLQKALMDGIAGGLEYYKSKPEFAEVYDAFTFLVDIDKWREAEIKSSGYVVDTLQASLWCLYTSSGYAESVLKAVNLGEDTDTNAAVTGALAGMWFGEEQIPVEWREKTVKYGTIRNLSQRFCNACLDNKE